MTLPQPKPYTIALLGSWPPPWGGISVHVQRLAQRLEEHGYRVVVLDTEGEVAKERPRLYRAMPPGRSFSLAVARAVVDFDVDLLNLHVFGAEWKILLPISALQGLLAAPVVVTLHSLRNCAETMPRNSRVLFSHAARTVQHFLCAGDHVRRHLLPFGVDPARATTIVPYLAPPATDPLTPLAAPLEAFLASHHPVVSSGTGILVTYDGRDLYGLDLFVRVANIVRRAHPQVGFVFVLAGYCDEELLSDAEVFIADNDLGDTVYLFKKAIHPATTLWARSDLFLRATLSDGDAISLREAMSVGTASLASNAVARPEGCWTHETADIVDCARQMLAMLGNLADARGQASHPAVVEGLATVLHVFEQALIQPAARTRALSRRLADRVLDVPLLRDAIREPV